MISLRLDGYAWSHHSHGRMRIVTLGRPVPRTTLQKEEWSESHLIRPSDIRSGVHPQVCRIRP